MILDEYTVENLSQEVEQNMTSEDVIDILTKLFAGLGLPKHLRIDNGSEFNANAIQDRRGNLGVETLYIDTGIPWENACSESFNSRFRDEFLAL